MAMVLGIISIPKIVKSNFYREVFQATAPVWLVSVYMNWDS